MPEVTITYKNKKTPEALKGLPKYFDFIISKPKKGSNKSHLLKASKNLNLIITALIDDAVTSEALTMIENYTLSHKLALPDAFIAATASVADLELFTYNTRDYRFISGLVLY